MQEKELLRTAIIRDFATIACPNCSVIGLFHFTLTAGTVIEQKRTANSYLICGHCGHCVIVRSSLLKFQEIEDFLGHYRNTNKVILEVNNFRATSFTYRGTFVTDKSNTCEECKQFLIHSISQHSPGILIPLINSDLLRGTSTVDLLIIKGCLSCDCYLSHSVINNFMCNTERAVFTELATRVNKISFYSPDVACKGPTYFGETADMLSGKYMSDTFTSPLNLVGEFRLHASSVLSKNYKVDTISEVVKSMCVGTATSNIEDQETEEKSRVVFIEI
jgi:hypothetical protein